MMNEDYTILVVDDSIGSCRMVAEMLLAEKYVVETANNGKEALLKLAIMVPDLLLIDVVMPEMDGLELLNEINVNEHEYEVIMMTGHESLQDAKKAMEYGAFSYVAKPLEWEELIGYIKKALNVVRIKKERLRRLAVLENEIQKRNDELQMSVKILEGQSKRLDAVINSMEEGLLAIDDHNCIVLMNARAEKIFGIQFGECAGESLASAIKDPYTSFQLASFIASSTGEFTLTLPVPGGGVRHYHLNAQEVIGEKGVCIGRVFTLLDQTDKINAEQLRISFLSTMAHELRTPITIVMNYLTLIKGVENREAVSDMKSACYWIDGLVGKLLSLTWLSDSSASVKKSSVDIAELAHLMVEKLNKDSAEKKVTVIIDNSLLSPVISTDPKLLGIALSGLLENAIKFSKDGGSVRLKLEAPPENAPSSVSLSIMDHGIGISERIKARLFENFTQGEDHMTRHYHGVGIGLYLVKRAVELLGGRIDVASTEGEGSCFTFTIPIADDAAPSPKSVRENNLQIVEES
jgi:two-component system, OmpR family, phosphate regulon sensor histidine kinase PhoR